jgi:heme/copper-type cytochrome/quinol oxidase subunit 2
MSFRLADAIFWVAVVSCTIAQLAIVHSVIISPASKRAADSATPASVSRRASEIAWAVLPGIALAVVLVYTRRAMA